MMSPELREDWILHQARQRPVAERAVFLDGACAGDFALRERLEMLLIEPEQPETLLATQPEADRPTMKIPFADEPADETVGQSIGRYKVLEKIGEGGCGVVYVAEQTEPVRRRVALKVIKLGMDTKQVVARFEAERQALAMMDHPNIAKVLDAGATESGRPFFVMELVRGIRITDYCDQANLATKERLDLFIQVCHAVQHAHQKGIIHRDIKPSNILVTLHDGVPVPKVIDFGIAKATEGRLTDNTVYTQLHQFIGTPAYMSPEQAEMSGLDIDTRSDIYSLGVLLYELLAGRTPFDANELMSKGIDVMRKMIREQEPPRPSTRLATLKSEELTTTAKRRSADAAKLLHQLKGDLDWIVMKCLEKDRTRRYETANGLAFDLKRYLNNEAVLARPPSAAYKFQKAFRRNKLVFGAAAAVAGALLVGLGIAAIGWHQTRVERDRAVQARKEAQVSEQKALQAGQRALAGEQEAQRAAAILKRTAYVGDMALVQQAIAEGNLARARRLLDRYRPKAAEEDIRGFEWRYLWAQARSDEVAQLGEYGGFLGGLAFSPDGMYLASVARQGVEIRSLHNHALILTLTNAGGGPIGFSPDGQSLVTVRDGGLGVWSTRTWKEASALTGLGAPFVFAQNGRLLVALRGDHLSLWNNEKDGKIVDVPGTVRLNRHSQGMAVSPDGNTVSVAGGGAIRSWDLTTQTELEPMSYPSGGTVVYLAVSAEGFLAAAHWNGQVTLWDLKTRHLLHTFEDHLAWVSSVVFSPDGDLLASASADQNIFLYETRSGKLLRRFKGHEGEIWALQYSPDGRWLVSGSGHDHSVRLWDVTSQSKGRDAVEMSVPLRFVDSNRSLICASETKGFARVDVKTGTLRPMASVPVSLNAPDGALGADFSLSLSPDGLRAAARLPDGRRLQVWNTLSGEREAVLTNSPGVIETTAFSEDGRRLAAAGNGSPVCLWDLTDWSSQLLGDPISSDANRLVFSPDGSRLAAADGGGVSVFDLASRKVVFRFRESQVIESAISRDGRLLAAGTGHNLIHVWSLNSGEKLGILRGHVAGVLGLSFSPDGKTLASCGDNRVKLWNIETMQEILTLARFSSVSGGPLFSSDGSCLATSSADHVQLWRAPSFEEIAAADAKEEAQSKHP
jgi:eukaryotic-like serine/threonine-protein kinase